MSNRCCGRIDTSDSCVLGQDFIEFYVARMSRVRFPFGTILLQDMIDGTEGRSGRKPSNRRNISKPRLPGSLVIKEPAKSKQSVYVGVRNNAIASQINDQPRDSLIPDDVL